MTSTSETERIRQNIISSLFSSTSKGSAGQTGQSYISHCKTWEDTPGGEQKPRYILLAVSSTPQVFLHKSKRNSNGSFSIGKTWDAIDLRAIELIDDVAFKLTIASRSYTWMAEDVYERADFVNLLVRSFYQYTNGSMPTLVGMPKDDYSLPAYPVTSSVTSARTHAQNPPPPLSSLTPRSQQTRIPISQAQPPRSPSASTRPQQPSRAGSVEPNSSPSARALPTGSGSKYDASSQRSRTPVLNDDTSPRPSKFGKPSKQGLVAKDTTAPSSASGRIISSPLRSTNDKSTRSRNSSLLSAEKDKPPLPAPAGLRSAKSSKRADDDSNLEGSSESKTASAPVGLLDARKDDQTVPEGTFEAHDVLANVEEMLEGFEWKMIGVGTGVEGMDQIEERLLTELKALELAEIHAIIENDDRVDLIGRYLDESLAELDKMEAMMSLYKTQLNIVSDDVTHIESQNRGFQVQISNQRSLLEEIEELVQTIHIPRSVLDSLVQEPLDSQKGINNLEISITTLYKAILSVKDITNVAAGSENSMDEYKREAKQFCKRVYEFLVVMFKYQADLVLNDETNRSSKSSLKLPSHESMEKYLERYCGLTLFIKEIDEVRYQQLCAAYFATSSELHKQEIGELITACRVMIRRPGDDELDAVFATPVPHSPSNSKTSTTRKPLAMFDRRDKKDSSGLGSAESLTGGQALQSFFRALLDHLQKEQSFVGDFLHIQSGLSSEGSMMITFADYANLEGYFKKAAGNLVSGSAKGKMQDLVSVMELIFGFLPGDIKEWIEWMVSRDPMQIVSVLAALDTMIKPAQEVRNEFLVKTLEAQQRKCLSVFERNIKDQLKAIESTKLTVKKRKGVVGFIARFPEFVARLERQLELDGGMEMEVDGQLPARKLVDKVYGQVVQTMFDALQTMARSDEASTGGGGGRSQDDRDKDRLNYHTLIIENMHHFVTTVSKVNAPAMGPWLEQAKEQYDQNLNLYIRLVLRRPLARFIDFFQGIQQLLRTTSPSDIPMHSQYTKSSLKRLLSSFDKKDLRKAIEALGKRVDKHFADVANPSAENKVVMDTVWAACENELKKWITEWKGVITKCYTTDMVSGIEFGEEEVKAAFLKYKPEHAGQFSK